MPTSIIPDSTVWLLHRVPLDSSYQHTLFFNPDNAANPSYANSIQNQFSTFVNPSRGWLKFTLNNQMYKRKGLGVIKVLKNVEELYDINYMIFVNKRFADANNLTYKYFYAFVNDVEYINENVTAIYYQLDVMQTWWFDYALGECFVEREHTSTDELFEHTLEEEIGTGETVLFELPEPRVPSQYEDGATYNLFSDLGLFITSGSSPYRDTLLDMDLPDTPPYGCLAAISHTSPVPTFDIRFQRSLISAWNGTASGLYTQQFIIRKLPISYPLSNITEDDKYWQFFRAECYLAAMGNDIENVVNVFQAPAAFWNRPNDVPTRDDQFIPPANTPPPKNYEINPVYYTIKFPIRTGSFSFAGVTFTPKNKKCYCYPYNFFLFTSSDGNSVIYKPELFTALTEEYGSLQAAFKITGIINGDFECTLFPMAYDGLPINYTNSLACFKTPVMGWTSDTFRAWLAQHKTTLIMDAVKTVGKIGVGIAAASVAPEILATPIANETYLQTLYGLATPGSKREMLTAAKIEDANRMMAFRQEKADMQMSARSEAANISNLSDVFSSTTASISQIGEAMALPPGAHGGNTNLLDVAEGIFGMKFYQGFVKPEFLKKIDDYFTRYGYAVKELKTPNRNNRTNYTFLKTTACTIVENSIFATTIPSVPNTVKNQLIAIYNNGITFWKDPDHVGDYYVNNDPLF